MTDKQNEKLMHFIRHVHGPIDSQNIVATRLFQNKIGTIFSTSTNYTFTYEMLNTMHCEWTQYKGNSLNDTIILYCHGGGFISGSCLYARGLTTKLAKYSKFPVFAFDYRLAPEHPFPAALNDAINVWFHLLSKGLESKNIIIAGDSAGGNLALALTLYLREHGMPLPKCLLLFSPWTDLSGSGESYDTKASVEPVLSTNYLRKASEAYRNAYTVKYPYISPLTADLHNFPPVHIQVGENEILLSDSLLLHKKLILSEVDSHIDIFPHMWHVFQLCPFPLANHAIKKLFTSMQY